MIRAGEGLAATAMGYPRRLVPPRETVVRVRRMCGPLGITRIANVTGLDCIGIPVVMVCRPNGRSLAVSQGKGADLSAAQASGLMEALELHHAERITQPLKLASWNELRFSHELVPVEELPRVSISTFDTNGQILWIEGYDLQSSKLLWLPYELVHMNYTLPLPPGTGSFVLSSNGLASGNHMQEAILHGLCEVIERDAATLFRLRGIEQQEAFRVNLDTIGGEEEEDKECLRMLERYRQAGIAVGVWDVTSDVRIPALKCVIVDRAPNSFRPLGPTEGVGCHPIRGVALLRSLTEAAQARLTLIAGSRDDNGRVRYEATRDALRTARARERLAAGGHRRFDAIPTLRNHSLEKDVAAVLLALRRAGLSHAVVVDLTKHEFGVPVVRIVVPGLETYHHVEGYVPGSRARRMIESLTRGDSA
jgi:YcaO-like protein with predicted kinase domain